MIACFLSNICAKYCKNPSMLSRVTAKNVGDVFFETQCISPIQAKKVGLQYINLYDSLQSPRMWNNTCRQSCLSDCWC